MSFPRKASLGNRSSSLDAFANTLDVKHQDTNNVSQEQLRTLKSKLISDSVSYKARMEGQSFHYQGHAKRKGYERFNKKA